jgi:hypothetical protein
VIDVQEKAGIKVHFRKVRSEQAELARFWVRDACLTAFRHNNWLGLTLWVAIALALAVR